MTAIKLPDYKPQRTRSRDRNKVETALEPAPEPAAPPADKTVLKPRYMNLVEAPPMMSQPLYTEVSKAELRERLAACRRAGMLGAVGAMERELLHRAKQEGKRK